MTALQHRPGSMSLRHLREPGPPAVRGSRSSLAQPLIWLLLFGALFKSVAEIPGFDGGSYLDFLDARHRRHERDVRRRLGRAWA